MADEETDVHVEVSTPDEHEEPTVEEHHTVVVTDSGDGGIHPSVADFMAKQSAINEQILANLTAANDTAENAAAAAEVATSAVDEAVEAVEDIAAGVAATVEESKPIPTAEDDTDPPNAEHPWFRRNKGNNG